MRIINTTIFCLAVLWMCISPICLIAQKNRFNLSEQDTSYINRAAKNTIKAFFETMSFITDPSYGPDDKKVFMDKSFTTEDKIFVDRKKSQIEDDHNPHVTSHSNNVFPLQAEEYLNIVSTTCRSENTDAPYVINWVSCVKKIAGRWVVKVRYTQTLNFIYSDSAALKYEKVTREAILFAQKTEAQVWKTYINSIGFLDTANIADDNLNCINITNSLETAYADTESSRQTDRPYFDYLLKKGTQSILSKNYLDAYISLKKAAKAPQTAKRAKELITNNLYTVMAKNGVENPDNYLADKLQKLAREMADLFRTREALLYYSYAYALNPSNSGLGNHLEDMSTKLENENKMQLLYAKGVYTQAISEYTAALADEENKKNPFLHMWLAKCYAKINDNRNADKYFNKAIKLDPNAQEIYHAQAEFYKDRQNPDFKKAYQAYVNELNHADDKNNPNCNAINSNITFCMGMTAFNNNDFYYAADSFRSAIKFNRNSKEAFVMLGRSESAINRTVEAITSFKDAIKLDNQYGEAYYRLGVTYWSATVAFIDKDYSAQAIEALRQAVSIDATNGEWNLDLGMRLLRHRTADSSTYKFYSEAIKCFSNCIKYDSIRANQAHIARGKCYYALGKYQEALEDYQKVDTNCLSNILFYNELGFILLKSGKYAEAKYCFNKNAIQNSRAMLGMGEAIYLTDVSNPNKEDYYVWFRRAFNNGVSHEFVNNEEVIAQLTKSDKAFKKLRKLYAY
jgi:tetratricopeptide (TPR) repeat protein